MEPFKPNRGPLKLSENMIIENLARVLDIATETVDSIADVSDSQQGAESPNDWRRWSADEAQTAFGEPSSKLLNDENVSRDGSLCCRARCYRYGA